MESKIHGNSTSNIRMLILILLFLCPCVVSADSPVDFYFVRSSDIDRDVQSNAIGVLSVTIPGSYGDFKQRENGVMELAGRKWLFVSKKKRINTYTPVSDAFKANGALTIADMKIPVRRLFEGGVDEGVKKFQIVSSRGEYRRILYDASRGLKAWIKPSEIPKPTSYIFIPGLERIDKYTMKSGAFVADGALDIIDIVPINGHLWFDELSEATHTLRFPIVGVKGSYRQIVYNPILDLKAWIHLPELSKLMKPLTWYEPAEAYFTGKYFRKAPPYTLFVDLFFFTKSRKLYHSPDESASFDLITPHMKDPNDPGDYFYGYGTITRIRDGFALICDINPCGEWVRQIGWIKIRDEDGRITIWMTIPLSC